MHKKKDAAAVALGRKGGEASARKLTDEQRREKARKAARAKWAKNQAQPVGTSQARTPRNKRMGKLTPREREVAEYAARGQSNSEIARLLRIGVNTVKKHVGHAFEKLGVVNRTELAVLLMEYRNDAGKGMPGLNANIIGSMMLDAAKEAYEMAQYLSRQGQPSSETGRNKLHE